MSESTRRDRITPLVVDGREWREEDAGLSWTSETEYGYLLVSAGRTDGIKDAALRDILMWDWSVWIEEDGDDPEPRQFSSGCATLLVDAFARAVVGDGACPAALAEHGRCA